MIKNNRRRVIKILSAILAAVLICAAVVSCEEEKEVMKIGKDIGQDDITEFYYTIDSSTNPPHFLRYRFFLKDGEYYFYHEKRAGNHWPLTESDITEQGTVKLDMADRAEFFESVAGGSVRKKKENTESGRSGPFLFIYWRGDKGEYRAFTFASGGLARFESLCENLLGRLGKNR